MARTTTTTKVWVVFSEFNRGYDLEGSATLEGVYATKAAAKAGKTAAETAYTEMGCPVYDGDADEDADWGVHVHLEEREVEA